jgi:hypothetical protein
MVAVLSLGGAGYAAASGRGPDGHGRPSVVPPPGHHGHGHGYGGGDGGGHGHGGGGGQGHGRGDS